MANHEGPVPHVVVNDIEFKSFRDAGRAIGMKRKERKKLRPQFRHTGVLDWVRGDGLTFRFRRPVGEEVA